MPNRLAQETSPYLLQHADNPVDWFPWGQEALRKATAEDNPIFLSIGYSACHWCHVMAHESFEDEQVAAILNQHFVSVKVDREERPDLDRIYMSAVQALTGRGGWPMSVFLTPDGHPFYGGTYFPPTARYGMPSFTDVLLSVADAWQNRREESVAGGRRLAAAIERQSMTDKDGTQQSVTRETLKAAFQNLWRRFDHSHGGWGDAPKFPQPMVLEFLLRYQRTTADPPTAGATEGARLRVLEQVQQLSDPAGRPNPPRMTEEVSPAEQMVFQTLDSMARGGMYDQLGGGFHRYSVDDHWLAPHFEKMLYDNAQLARVYLHAWQTNGDPFYRAIAEEILDYVMREMTDPAGGFYATQDADSEGEEGKFFVWTAAEIQATLGGRAGPFMAAYAVSAKGNFEGRNILELVGRLKERDALADARRCLFEVREQRIHPGRDEKVLTSWNGLMLAAFAEAARALKRDDYRQVAEHNADFVLSELQTADGRLRHAWKDGRSKINGYLEDYTHLIEGLLELYQTTFCPRWYQAARKLADGMIEHFSAPGGGFFDTSDDHERLITRPRELQDNAVPSGNAMAATVLLRLAGLTVEPRYAELARHSLGRMQSLLAQSPLGFGQWLIALDYALAHPREIAIVGDPGAADTRALLEVCAAGYRPYQSVAVGAPDTETAALPLLQNRSQIRNRATAYVCVDFTCRPPVTDPAALRLLLE
jgi:uncharacterized protein YyaL (SSP411 family)